MRTGVLVFGLVASVTIALVPSAAGATDTTGCSVKTTSAARVGDLYLTSITLVGGSVYTEIFLEDNGVDGLQRKASSCADGHVIAPDACLEGYAADCSPLTAAP